MSGIKRTSRKTPKSSPAVAPRRGRTAAPTRAATPKRAAAPKQAPAPKRAAAAEPHHHPHPTVRAQPLIAVRDVPASARWYAKVLGAESLAASMPSDHDHIYDRLVSDDGLVLQLHAWDEEDHPNLVGANAARLGHGVLLWFEVDDFDAAVKRIRTLRAKVIEDVHVNPGPRHREIWIRDPDDYVVVIVSPDGEATTSPKRSGIRASRAAHD